MGAKNTPKSYRSWNPNESKIRSFELKSPVRKKQAENGGEGGLNDWFYLVLPRLKSQ